MKNASSCMNLQRQRAETPFKHRCNVAARIMKTRNYSPDGYIKLKSAMNMYQQIKSNVTPLKDQEFGQHSIKNIKHGLILPIRSSKEKINQKVTKLSIRSYGVGNQYAKALSSSMKELSNLQELNLRSNRIEDEGIFSIISSINRSTIKILDISNNKIGLNAISALIDLISNTSIEKLSLENTNLSYPGLKSILSALKPHPTVSHLNLACNKLGPGSGLCLKDFLTHTASLNNLDLHWNFIKGQESVQLFEGLQANASLQSLDISWNSFGSDSTTIHALCNFLASGHSLRHLDLSNNRISADSCALLGKALEKNRTLLGIHMEGNHGKVDHLGFVSAVGEIEVPKALQTARILRTPKRAFAGFCWICDMYVDVEVIWNPLEVGWGREAEEMYRWPNGSEDQPVFVHMDIDGYKPILMKNTGTEGYKAIRAAPKGTKIGLFFSYRGFTQVSSRYRVESAAVSLNVECRDNTVKELKTDMVNLIDTKECELTCQPRPILERYFIEIYGDKVQVKEWTIQTSIFSSCIYDNDEITRDCFEFDWKSSKIAKIIKSDLIRAEAKELVRAYYNSVLKTYKLYAALGTNGIYFSINLALLTEICQKCKVFDKLFRISDVDLALKASKYSQSTSSSAYGLVRHEFLEFLIRIALDKYYRSGICNSEKSALTSFFLMNFSRLSNPYEPCKWRFDRFYSQKCEEVITENNQVFFALFSLYSGTKAKPGEKKFMLVEDFITLCQNHEILSENFNLRHATLCFHMALMPHVDEITMISHMQAGFIEFVEALARVAEHLHSEDPESDMLGYIYVGEALEKKLYELIKKHLSKYILRRKSKAKTNTVNSQGSKK